jgi:hypothetical protein
MAGTKAVGLDLGPYAVDECWAECVFRGVKSMIGASSTARGSIVLLASRHFSELADPGLDLGPLRSRRVLSCTRIPRHTECYQCVHKLGRAVMGRWSTRRMRPMGCCTWL